MRGGLPHDWTIGDHDVRLSKAPESVRIRTGTSPSGYQLISPTLRLRAGIYGVVIDGSVREGGLLIGAHDVAAQRWISTAYYREGQAFDQGRSMATIFTLPHTTSLNIILANWRVDTGSSEWQLRSVEIGTLRESGRVADRARLVDAPPEVRDLLPRARTAIAGISSDWDRAARVRDIVRAELDRGRRPTEVADALWQVGSQLGLSLRVVHSSANALNEHDTHAAVEVWIEDEERWAISDPTFGGYWSLADRKPIGALTLSEHVRGGRKEELIWNGSGGQNSLLPSQHPVDPLELYRYVSVAVTVGDARHFVLAQPTTGGDPTVLGTYVAARPEQLATARPGSRVDVLRQGSTSEVLTEVSKAEPAHRPPYAAGLIASRSVESPPAGRIVLSIPYSGPAVVTLRGRVHGATLHIGTTEYVFAGGDRLKLSPVIMLPSTSTLTVRGARGRVGIDVWEPARFPASRES